MSAITLAQKKIQTSGDSRVFLETLGDLGLLKESVEEILAREELVDFFKTQKTGRKKPSLTDEERLGQYDGVLCDARLWKEKPRSGGLGYDNIQCSSKKADGCDCLCKKHFKMQEEGTLWTGLITEDRPEEPTKSDGTQMVWSTDKDGNDVVKEKKRKKSSEPKKKGPKKSTKKSTKKDDEEFSMDELAIDLNHLEALLVKAKKKDEEKVEAKKKDEEKVEAEKKDSLAEAKEAMLKMSEDLKDETKKEKDETKKEEKETKKEEKETKKDEDTEDLSEEEEDDFEDITFDGTEYQRNKEDNVVIRVDDFSPVGVWNTDTETIDFDEEE
jgi:hypothetical protein